MYQSSEVQEVIEDRVCESCHPIYSGHEACGRTSRGHTGGSY